MEHVGGQHERSGGVDGGGVGDGCGRVRVPVNDRNKFGDDKLIKVIIFDKFRLNILRKQMLKDKKEKTKHSTKNIELKLKNSNENF